MFAPMLSAVAGIVAILSKGNKEVMLAPSAMPAKTTAINAREVRQGYALNRLRSRRMGWIVKNQQQALSLKAVLRAVDDHECQANRQDMIHPVRSVQCFISILFGSKDSHNVTDH